MSAIRLLVLTALAAAALTACSTYKQVDDPSDGSNAKTKLQPSSVAR
jgi:outer membrane protein assembly factor BamE (lipoprotein component of BamABCDE complex)